MSCALPVRGWAGFNSLQTGNHIQSLFVFVFQDVSRVSIPFKRETISKGDTEGHSGQMFWKFQFPSNGKPYPKHSLWNGHVRVSGFNSLQTGNHIQRCRTNTFYYQKHSMFQFPSNGKPYPKGLPQDQFEPMMSFNSLQTGNHIQSLHEHQRYRTESWLFQFPSNGKPYPKTTEQPAKRCLDSSVSIPFKRESISKEYKKERDARRKKSFNSLQTGNHIQRQMARTWKISTSKFQFPSNGKPYPKELNNNVTGWCGLVLFQFPSNGKPYPKGDEQYGTRWRLLRVSIPFKRETISKVCI